MDLWVDLWPVHLYSDSKISAFEGNSEWQKCCHIVCIQYAAAFLWDLEAAAAVVASVEADALTEAADALTEAAAAEVAVAEIEVTEAVIVVVVDLSAAGDEDAYGSEDELHSLPRS